MDGYDLREVLKNIDPARLDYTEWVNVGMALKDAGLTASDWDDWSKQDVGRYNAGECFKKWDGFYGASNPVTAGTIVQLAKNQGWQPERKTTANSKEIGWDDFIGVENNDLIVVDKTWIEGEEINEPGEDWKPVSDLIKYLEVLFEASENVGYVTESWKKEDDKGSRYLPTKGSYSRTAGELIEQLNGCHGDISAVLGDYKPEAGAWIRFNPLDGKGVKNDNVTDYRYALVESDDMSLDKQNAMLRELELPIAAMVYSGKKSIHAIVKIDAGSYEEYRKRVDYLYNLLKNNGMTVDTQNKNPSRLSRMPGVLRNGRKQFLIDTSLGKDSWQEWQEYIEGINDNLPDPDNLAAVWNDMPELSPPLIDGVLRQGHKMLLAGPSKAGKSYALIELCIAIAEGKKWLTWDCAKGKVMYVNLELDKASCMHRFKDVYNFLGLQPENIDSIDIWNLRGNSVPMDKLAPKLIRRAAKKNYIAIVIDPIYKIITGDENSADQMAHFCNQFDKVCTELGCAVIYCHHHSKGMQGNKRSMDRASGSGVFARDPDALLDYIELEQTDSLRKQQENNAVCSVCQKWLDRSGQNINVSQDDILNESTALATVSSLLGDDIYREMLPEVYKARQAAKQRSAWRIEGTLREFARFDPVNLWFDYPVHRIDDTECLKDLKMDGEQGHNYRDNFSKKKSASECKKIKMQEIEDAFNMCADGEKSAISDIAEYLDVTDKTARNRLKKHGNFWIDNGFTGIKEREKVE